MSYTGFAALPVGESIDPQNLQDSSYFDTGWVAYVLFKTSEMRTRPTRVFTSHGPLSFDRTRTLKLGDEIELYHDQTGAQMGTYRVDGIVRFDANGQEVQVGNVPSLKIKHCVAK